METVGISESDQVETLCSAIAALCCTRATSPADLRGLLRACVDDIHNRGIETWRTADAALKALRA